MQRDLYGHPEVRASLEKLFHEKCAYCESRITPGFDWEVEHFRPKGEVAERPDHPGYYWLAYEWSNLYPTCTLCNQRRKDRPRWEDPTWAGPAGKANQFPLLDESHRAMSPNQDLTLEKPLLIDPCQDAPEDFLSYNVLGEALSIEDNLWGTATIEVFHLNRRRLCDLRRSVAQEILRLLTLLSARRHEISVAARADLEDWLQRHFLSDECAYSGVARALLRNPVAFGAAPHNIAGSAVDRP